MFLDHQQEGVYVLEGYKMGNLREKARRSTAREIK